MTQENLGAGQFLDRRFDFSIDPTGDIQSSRGVDELEKDLAVQMASSLSQYLGSRPTPEVEAEIKRSVYRVAAADSRINVVNREEISVEWKNRLRELEIEVSVVTEVDEEYEMVFNV